MGRKCFYSIALFLPAPFVRFELQDLTSFFKVQCKKKAKQTPQKNVQCMTAEKSPEAFGAWRHENNRGNHI